MTSPEAGLKTLRGIRRMDTEVRRELCKQSVPVPTLDLNGTTPIRDSEGAKSSPDILSHTQITA
jgi:hypothetical protein